MPTKFAPGDERQEDTLNPGQQDYDRRFNDMRRFEERGSFDDIANNYDKTADPSQEDANIRKLQDREANADTSNSGWANNVNPANKDNKTKFSAKNLLKKKGPLAGILGMLGIGGFGLSVLFSPSILIVQMKEVIMGKVNTQISSMEARTNKLYVAKLKNQTNGVCTSVVSIRCKFASMSDKQIRNMEKAGIKVNKSASGRALPGRSAIESLELDGKTISANEFTTLSRTDPRLRSALQQAYSPKYAGFIGKVWKNVANRFKINKKPVKLNAAADEAKAKANMNSIAKEGTSDRNGATRLPTNDGECSGASCIEQENTNKINSTAEALENGAKSGEIGNNVKSGLRSLSTSRTFTSALKVTGYADFACQGYGAMNALSYATKAIRSAQLIRYSMIFLNVADTIKAGDSPDPADIALLGGILTTTIKDNSNPTKTIMGSATDSFGYKYAAYNDITASKTSMDIANRFTSGSSFGGSLAGTSDAILGALGGSRKQASATCGTLSNPVVGGASLILGIASLAVPGVGWAKTSLQIAGGVALTVALSMLPELLADIVAGTVTDDIAGEESGNAIVSGAGALMSDALAAQTGNAPMTKEDAIAYNGALTDTRNQYIADEIRELSPFDTSSPYTFLGSITSKLLPLQSSSNPITTVASLISTSFSGLIGKSASAADADYAKTLNVCEDLDVVEAGYAADPFCNVIRGIPPKYLDRDPLAVADAVLDANDQPSAEYTKFVSECITTDVPLGYREAETKGFDVDAAKSCIINDTNANYYLFHMDQIINDGMDGEFDETAETVAPVDGESLPTGNEVELAQQILAIGNVNDRTGQLNQIVNGSRTNVSAEILRVIAALGQTNKFTISSMKRDQILDVGAGSKSLHLQGRAVDISGAAGVNGVSFGYNGHNPAIQSFINRAASILPANCSIGVPNQAYVNATRPVVKPGCRVFVDLGTAPHIHLDVRQP